VSKSALLFAAGLFVAVASIAQAGQAALFGTLNGVVEDPQGSPLPQANVRVYSAVSG